MGVGEYGLGNLGIVGLGNSGKIEQGMGRGDVWECGGVGVRTSGSGEVLTT